MRDLIKKILREDVTPKVADYLERKLRETLYTQMPFSFRIMRVDKEYLISRIISVTVDCVNLSEALRSTTMDYYIDGVKLFYDGLQIAEINEGEEVDDDVFQDDDHIKTMLLKMAATNAYHDVDSKIREDIIKLAEVLSMDDCHIFLNYR